MTHVSFTGEHEISHRQTRPEGPLGNSRVRQGAETCAVLNRTESEGLAGSGCSVPFGVRRSLVRWSVRALIRRGG